MRLNDKQYTALQRIQGGGTLGPREYRLWSGLWRAGLLRWLAEPRRGLPRYELSGRGEAELLRWRLRTGRSFRGSFWRV